MVIGESSLSNFDNDDAAKSPMSLPIKDAVKMNEKRETKTHLQAQISERWTFFQG